MGKLSSDVAELKRLLKEIGKSSLPLCDGSFLVCEVSEKGVKINEAAHKAHSIVERQIEGTLKEENLI